MLLIPVIAARKVISMHPSQQPVGISSRGLEVHEQGKVETLEWGRFALAIERTEVYILRRESVVFPYPIPKRAFASPEQAAAFRELLISRGLLKAKG
ncbi:MAG: YcxB family protein [Fimbriimonadaceae bacterium]|nr:YcxB family protein [Fimbriimonadaceae bacterium]